MRTMHISILFAAVLSLSIAGGTAFATSDDSIFSAHITEADGTTGQDTNTGNGIKSGHIQDGAVTDSKLADGAATNSKIADGAVTDDKISGTVSGYKLGAHSHTSDDISGAIGVDRLQTYENVRIVHKGSADGINTFNTITGAINSITDASETKPYTVFVMPGTYEEHVVMSEWVSLRGAGRENTKISRYGSALFAADNTSIEDMWIEVYNGPGGGSLRAVDIEGCSPVIRNCTLRIAAGQDSATLFIYGGNPVIDNCTVLYNSYYGTTGIYLGGPASKVRISNTVIEMDTENSFSPCYPAAISVTGVYGVMDIQIDNCKISTADGRYAITGNTQSGGGVRFSSSMLDGLIHPTGSANFKIVNCFDKNYDPIPNQ